MKGFWLSGKWNEVRVGLVGTGGIEAGADDPLQIQCVCHQPDTLTCW